MPQKKPVTITIEPITWETFQALVKAKMPDGDKSASSHVQTLVEREITRLAGDVPAVVDVVALQRELLSYTNRFSDIKKTLKKRGALDRFNELGIAYKVDFKHYSNAADVINQVLKDRNKEGLPVQIFLNGEPESDLPLFIDLLEIKAKTDKINRQLLEAHEARYLPVTASDKESAVKQEEQGQEDTDSAEPKYEETKQQTPAATSNKQQSTPEEDDEEEDPDWYEEEESEWLVEE